MTKDMRSDKAQIANGEISSCIVEGTPVSKLRAWERLSVVIMDKVAALAWVITCQTFLEHFSDKAQKVAQTLQPLREQIIPCSPNLSDSV
jgi:hypothetical protein